MITVYERSGVFCGQCRSTKRMLDKQKIPYEVAELTDEKAEEARNAGFTSMPIVETADGQIWAGFLPDRIASLIDSQVA